MTARQRSASSLSHTSNASSPGGFSSSNTNLHDPDPLILCAAEIPSFHGESMPSSSYGSGGDSPYPAMTATYIPSGMPPTGMSRARAHTASAGTDGPGPAISGLQPRVAVQRNSMLPMHTGTGMRHVSTSQLEVGGRFGGGLGNGGGHYIPPPPPHPPPSATGLPALALNQREYQPQYVQRPDYKNSVNYPYSPQPPQSSHGAAPFSPHRPPPLQVPNYNNNQYNPSNYNTPRQEMYRQPAAQSSETSFLRLESADDYRNPPLSAGGVGITRSNHAQSPSVATSGASFSIPSDVAAVWSLDRVLNYLDRHHLPAEWVQAFRNLNICGTEFLELGYTQGLLTYVFAEVMRICPNADENKERTAAKNIKKMIREILKLAQAADDISDLPPLARQPGRRPMSTTRSVTMPVMAESVLNSGDSFQRQNGSEPALRGRSEFSKAALGSVDPIRHSPSNSESGFQSGRPSASASPHGSPSLGFQTSGRHGHSNSMESVRGEGKADRKALHVLGLLPRGSTDKTDSHESNRQNSLDQQQQQPRHGGGKILDKVKRRFFSKDGESHDDVSPTSPGWKHSLPNLPFASAEYNGSSSSIDRVSISSVDGMRRHRTSNAASNKASYAFVTKDGRVWILIDVTNIETPYALRREICANLDINDWENATITLAEIGQKAPHGKTSLGHLPWAFESWGQLARMKTKVIADSGSQRRFWWTAY
jgi:hypothetical protein